MTAPHVMFVSPSAYTLSGLATWLDYLMPGLEKRGWKVTLGLVAGPFHHQPSRYLEVHPFHHVKTIYCGTGTVAGRRSAMMNAIASVHPDLVVSVNMPDVYPAVRSLRSRGNTATRCVMTIHGIMQELVDDAWRYRDVLDAVVATNRLACALTIERGVSDERVLYASYGVRCPASLPVRAEPGRSFRVLYAGRLEAGQKRVHDLPRIMSGVAEKIGSVELEVAGDGPEAEAFFSKLAGLQHVRVVRSGVLSGNDLDSAYRRAHALIVPSFWETGPLVIWEAMAAELPVVSSRYVGSGLEAALIHERNCLMFDVGDTDAAASGLSRLANDASLAGSLRASAFELVKHRYSHDASVAMWDEALRKVLMMPVARGESEAVEEAMVNGRLDRLLGAGNAEFVRRLFGRRIRHGDPGGEWPHTHRSNSAAQESEFVRRAAVIDRSKPEA